MTIAISLTALVVSVIAIVCVCALSSPSPRPIDFKPLLPSRNGYPWRHFKGGRYRILGYGRAASSMEEGELVIIYQGEDGRKWIRTRQAPRQIPTLPRAGSGVNSGKT